MTFFLNNDHNATVYFVNFKLLLMLIILLFAFCFSLICGIVLIRFRHLHERFTADSDLGGVQKFHATPVPRIGGVPVFFGLIAGVIAVQFKWPTDNAWLLLLAALPAWCTGLMEDVTKRVGPTPRLLATFVSALLGFWLLGAALTRLSLPGVDYLLSHFWIFSAIFTMIAVGGVAHALNIIDGYNGLAGMIAIIAFAVMAYIAWQVGDALIMGICLAGVGAIGGFFVLNFPKGLIFFGDGGAYVIGFFIAEMSVMLVARNPEVSPWFPMLLMVYPVFETLFSMYRKKFMRHMSPSQPDGIHLHMLVYKRLVRWKYGSTVAADKTMRNSLTSPYLWVFSLIAMVPAALFWRNTIVLLICTFLYMLFYLFVYFSIVHFKMPSWLVLHKK